MQRADYIDQEISMLIPILDEVKLERVKSRGVKTGGIWLASPGFVLLKRPIAIGPKGSDDRRRLC